MWAVSSVIVLHGVLDALMCFCMHMVHLNNNNISCACSVLCGHMAGLGRLYSHFHPSISVDCRACAVCHQCVTSLTLAVKLADMHVCIAIILSVSRYQGIKYSYFTWGTVSQKLLLVAPRKEWQKVHVHKTNAQPTHKNGDERITQSKHVIE